MLKSLAGEGEGRGREDGVGREGARCRPAIGEGVSRTELTGVARSEGRTGRWGSKKGDEVGLRGKIKRRRRRDRQRGVRKTGKDASGNAKLTTEVMSLLVLFLDRSDLVSSTGLNVPIGAPLVQTSTSFSSSPPSSIEIFGLVNSIINSPKTASASSTSLPDAEALLSSQEGRSSPSNPTSFISSTSTSIRGLC